MLFDIQLNLKVNAHSEKQAEQQIFDLFKELWLQDYHNQYKIDEWDFVEYITEEDTNEEGALS